MDNLEKEILKAASIKDDVLKKHLLVLGILSDELYALAKKRPILVGEGAVEFYTFGSYTTGDIDLAFEDRELFGTVAGRAGFIRQGRHWYHPVLEVAVEIPASALEEETAPLATAAVEGKICVIIGIEDLIIDRLNAYVHWKSQSDGEWAKNLLDLNREKVNWTYLKAKAEKAQVLSALERIA